MKLEYQTIHNRITKLQVNLTYNLYIYIYTLFFFNSETSCEIFFSGGQIYMIRINCLSKGYNINSRLRTVSLWRRANARNVRPHYPYWQYTDLFVFRFVSLLCLRSTLRLKLQYVSISRHNVLCVNTNMLDNLPYRNFPRIPVFFDSSKTKDQKHFY